MLPLNTIPQEEPTINVGVIMPEDAFTVINLVFHELKQYTFDFLEESIAAGGPGALKLEFKEGEIHFEIGGQAYTSTDEIRIVPNSTAKRLHKEAGLCVKEVIAGRGFHWKKYIDVFLPGTIIIKPYKGHLILINELSLEQYVMCVATSEMGAACPPALIQSQTIVARSWILANIEQKHRHLGMDACNDDCCQRYQGSTHLSGQSVDGALNTYGQVLLHDGAICDARYSKSCGGVMETFESVWGGDPLPYMQAIPDAATKPPELAGSLTIDAIAEKWIKSQPDTFCSPKTIPETELKQYLGSVDDEGKYFRWEMTVTQEELTSTINTHNPVEAKAIKSLTPIKRGGSGRAIRMEVKYIDKENKEQELLLESEYAIRQSLVKKFMYSGAIIISPENESAGIPEKFHILGAGWGHGAGYCQIGALGMALKGYSTEKIVLHYYPGSELTKIYEE